MKKLLLILIVLLGAAICAKADVYYWKSPDGNNIWAEPQQDGTLKITNVEIKTEKISALQSKLESHDLICSSERQSISDELTKEQNDLNYINSFIEPDNTVN